MRNQAWEKLKLENIQQPTFNIEHPMDEQRSNIEWRRKFLRPLLGES